MSTGVEAAPLTEDDIAVFLEELSDNEMPCEAEHEANGNTCSVTVTHRCRVTCKGVSRNVCANEAKSISVWSAANNACNHCRRRLSVCWIINPI